MSFTNEECGRWLVNPCRDPKTGNAISLGRGIREIQNKCGRPYLSIPPEKLTKRSLIGCDLWKINSCRDPNTGELIRSNERIRELIELCGSPHINVNINELPSLPRIEEIKTKPLQQIRMDLIISFHGPLFPLKFYSLHVRIRNYELIQFMGFVPEEENFLILFENLNFLLQRQTLLLNIFPLVSRIQIPKTIEEWYVVLPTGGIFVNKRNFERILVESGHLVFETSMLFGKRTKTSLPKICGSQYRKFIVSYHGNMLNTRNELIPFYSVHREPLTPGIFYIFEGYIPDLSKFGEYNFKSLISDIRKFSRSIFLPFSLPKQIKDWFIIGTRNIDINKYRRLVMNIGTK